MYVLLDFEGKPIRYFIYQATCRIDGKLKHLGTFDTAEAASAAYEEFAKSSFGAFYKEAKAAATDHG